jgi:hypothetical protein
MFSTQQKREIAEKVQQLLRQTNHPELPDGEIEFHLYVAGAEPWSWAAIENNGAILNPIPNPWNEHYEDNPCIAFNTRGTLTERTTCSGGPCVDRPKSCDGSTASGPSSRG